MQNHNIKITVVIPLYNKEKSISKTLESVFAQSFADYEVVIVDDGSTDGSASVVSRMLAEKRVDERFLLIQKPNGGVCSARNRGISEAKYDYVAFLDADDAWEKEYLAEQVRMINDFPDAAMWGTNFAETRNGVRVHDYVTGLPHGFRGYLEKYFDLLGRQSDLYHSSAVVIRKSVFDRVGVFDERLRYSEDNDMWFRIIATHQVAFYDNYLVHYQLDAENRALNRKVLLKYDQPFVVDKYRLPIYKNNIVFYRWINRYSAQWIAAYYFLDPKQIDVAKVAMKKLDYSVIPFRYLLFRILPYNLGKKLYIKLSNKKK